MPETKEAPPHSPRLAALERAVRGGESGAIEAFWREVAAVGTPLIEATDDAAEVLVTFLWRADDTTENIVLVSELLNGWWWNRCADALFQRLADTNVWYLTRRVRADARFLYRLAPNDPRLHPTDSGHIERAKQFRPDPLNPRIYSVPLDAADPSGTVTPWSLVELPLAPDQPWITQRLNVPAGRVEERRLHSAVLGQDRHFWIYTPPDYAAADAECGLLLLFDGRYYTSLIPVPIILDNLLAARRIPPLIAVLVDTTLSRFRDLNCSTSFDTFVAHDLLSWVRQHYHISTDPAATVIGGLSLGAVAATYAALRHSDLFGNVLAQSGAFWNGRDGDVEGQEWLARQFVRTPKLPLRFSLEAGLMENQRDVPAPTILRATRHLRDVLEAKGYQVHYTEFNGGHQPLCWRGTLARGILTLTGTDEGKAQTINNPLLTTQ